MIYRFENFEIDTSRLSLSCDGQTLSFEPRVYDLLVYLLENRDRIVFKDQLLATVWQGRVVADTTISTAIKEARKLLGDSGEIQRYIETIRGKGFRFNSPDNLSVTESQSAAHSSLNNLSTSNVDNNPSSTPIKSSFVEPTLLILPFDQSLQNADDCALVNGLELSLNRVLLRIPLLKQLSINSFAADDLASLSARTAYERYGIRYLIKGIFVVRAMQSTLTIQLIDNKSGFQLWSNAFTFPAEQHSEAEILANVVAQLEPQLNQAIFKDIVAEKGEKNASALYLEASGLLATKGWHESTFVEATKLLKESVSKEPDFAVAYAYLSLLLAFGHRIGLISDREKVKMESIEMAELAMDLDPNDSTTLGFVGCAYCDLKLPQRGMPLLEKALLINPDNAQALVARGAAKLSLGEVDNGISDLERGIQQSPLDARLAVWESLLSSALLSQGKTQEALTAATRASLRAHKAYLPFVTLAAAHFVAKNNAAAKQSLSEAFHIKPDLSEAQIAVLTGTKLAGELIRLNANSL